MDQKTDTQREPHPHDIGIHFTYSHDGIIDQNRVLIEGTFIIMRFDSTIYTVDTAEAFIKEHRPFQHTIQGSYNPYGQSLTVWVPTYRYDEAYYAYALKAYS